MMELLLLPSSSSMFCLRDTKWQPTVSLRPSLIRALPRWHSLWLDQSVDLCCPVTFHDTAGASREGTLAVPPGNHLDSCGGGCHRALVFLMSPLTRASVVIAGEIWHPCWALNNGIYLPVLDLCCHLCSPWWNAAMLIFRGRCVLSVCSRVQSEASVASHGKDRLSTGWLSWQCPGLPRGPRAVWSGESRRLKDDKGQLEKWRTPRRPSQQWVMFSVSFPVWSNIHRTHCKFVYDWFWCCFHFIPLDDPFAFNSYKKF